MAVQDSLLRFCSLGLRVKGEGVKGYGGMAVQVSLLRVCFPHTCGFPGAFNAS